MKIAWRVVDLGALHRRSAKSVARKTIIAALEGIFPWVVGRRWLEDEIADRS